MDTDHPSTMSLAEAAMRAGIATAWAYVLAAHHELPFPTARMDGRTVVPVKPFEEWLAARWAPSARRRRAIGVCEVDPTQDPSPRRPDHDVLPRA